MFRNTFTTAPRRLRRVYPGVHSSHNSTRTPCLIPQRSAAIVAATTAVLLWYFSSNPVYNEAVHIVSSNASPTNSKRINSTGVDKDGDLCAVVWGSNKSNLIDPQLPGTEIFKTPVNTRWLGNIVLRDVALHERHAACVDARGNVFQWGNDFFGSKSDTKTPKATLRGKNIIKIQLTESRVYALSASGRIYVFAANEEQQKLPEPRTNSRVPWRASGWIERERQTIDYAEILPREKLNWGETFISIAAGSNHLLALTSEGRTYTHPMNKDANSHGQLGLRKIELPPPSSLTNVADHSRVAAELAPRSVVDKIHPSSRDSAPPTITNEHLNMIDDHHIRFSDALFEIPSLRGIKASQIAAGGRSSFVNTNEGRVLGWGANDHGRLGLGSGISLDTIIVPTETDLTKNIPHSTKSRCLNITTGGDLTYFVVERNDRESATYVDILSCGDGRWGGLGNGSFSTFQGNPVRVRNISGLREFDEQEQKLSPIIPHALSVSPTGHVLLSLDTQSHIGPGGSGRDLVTWGLNHEYQLGTGKKTSLNTPATLERPEGGLFVLAKRKATVKDLSGQVWKKDVEIEQCAIAGYGSSVVYWKVRSS